MRIPWIPSSPRVEDYGKVKLPTRSIAYSRTMQWNVQRLPRCKKKAPAFVRIANRDRSIECVCVRLDIVGRDRHSPWRRIIREVNDGRAVRTNEAKPDGPRRCRVPLTPGPLRWGVDAKSCPTRQRKRTVSPRHYGREGTAEEQQQEQCSEGRLGTGKTHERDHPFSPNRRTESG